MIQAIPRNMLSIFWDLLSSFGTKIGGKTNPRATPTFSRNDKSIIDKARKTSQVMIIGKINRYEIWRFTFGRVIHSKYQLKPLYTFGTEKKVHRFINKLQGLQKVMVKDFSWNIVPWNALLFEKTLKQSSILVVEIYGFILNTCHDTAKRAETRVFFPRYFLPTPMTDWA